MINLTIMIKKKNRNNEKKKNIYYSYISLNYFNYTMKNKI